LGLLVQASGTDGAGIERGVFRSIGRRGRVASAVALLAAALTVVGLLAGMWPGRTPAALAASPSCPLGSSMYTAAHEDDTILFMNPDLFHDIQAGRCVLTVFLTAGDAGAGESYWSSRERGAEAAYAQMAGVPDNWSASDAGIAGHPMPLMTLLGNPRVSIVFMRLPDGFATGAGYGVHDYESLQKLYTGAIGEVTAVDGSSSYTKSALTSTLTALMTRFGPDRIATQDFIGSFGDGDHSDHHATAYFTRDAHLAYNAVPHTIVSYLDYTTQSLPSNVTGADYNEKIAVWQAYAPYDSTVCQSEAICQSGRYGSWFSRQYISGSETGGPGIPPNSPPKTGSVAITPRSPTVGTVLAASPGGFSDPDGDMLTYHYQWSLSDQAVTGATGATFPATAAVGGSRVTVVVYADDGRGDVSGPVTASVTVPVDKIPPTISIASPTSTRYWTGQAVRVSFSCADASGIASCTASLARAGARPQAVSSGQTIRLPKAGHYTLTVSARDNSGNPASSGVPFLVRRDKRAPTISIVTPRAKTYRTGQTLVLRFFARDNVAVSRLRATLGLVGGRARTVRAHEKIRLSSPGEYVLRITARDPSGNSRVKTVYFRVQ
jgi:LmbE family N-acetylglucosaminyl deacetylase